MKGADCLVDGSSNLAKKFHIPEIVIGLTIVAIGTSMPELMVSVTSSLAGYSDLAIGNVIGSNIANLFLILGISSILRPLQFQKETKRFENPFMLACTLLLWIIANNGEINEISLKEGLLLLIFCFSFMTYQIMCAKRKNAEAKRVSLLEETKKISTVQSILRIGLGIIALKLGADWVVEGTEDIAKILGITERFISLTLIAFSTSLPELVTSISAARKGNSDIAIGNILGSQIFNILLILGTASVIRPIPYSIRYNDDLVFLIFGTILFILVPYARKKDQMGRLEGFVFVSLYILYLFFTLQGR